VRVDQLGQQRPVVAGRISNRPAADQAMPAVDAEVIFVTEGWDSQINPRAPFALGWALVYLTVQRASRSFWCSLAGLFPSRAGCGLP
jgi:hypothetical protein